MMGKRELVAWLSLSSWCLVIVLWLFLALPWVGLQFVIVVFPDQTHLLLFSAEEGRCIIIYVKTDINATKKMLIKTVLLSAL